MFAPLLSNPRLCPPKATMAAKPLIFQELAGTGDQRLSLSHTSVVYQLPFQGRSAFFSRVAAGWSVFAIVNLQSGNPLSPITQVTDRRGSLEAFNRPFLVPGVPLTVPNPSVDQSRRIGPSDHWVRRWPKHSHGSRIFGCRPVDRRENEDSGRVSLQFRTEAFNLFNHPNFGQPQNKLALASFSQITATGTIRGDLGSSRQIQSALKLLL
jgi:hypothetical protein